MKRVLLLTACLLLVMSTAAFAVPASDYSSGKTSVDLGFISSEINAGGGGESVDLNRKTNFDGGITTGLGGNFALQYKYQKANGSLESISTSNNIQELNVLYKVDKNFSVFAGVNRFSGRASVSDINIGDAVFFGSADIESSTKWQVGVLGKAKLDKDFTGWASAAAGDKNQTYEIGVGYKMSKEADLNLFYRYKRFNGLEINGDEEDINFDAKIKGWGMSVTLRF